MKIIVFFGIVWYYLYMSYRLLEDKAEWDEAVDGFGGHPLQFWGWGELKRATGNWSVLRVLFDKDGVDLGGAQVLVRNLGAGQKMFFVPRGPFGALDESGKAGILAGMKRFARLQHASILKLEPDWIGDEAVLRSSGFKPSENHVFIAKTAEIDLKKQEMAQLLAGFNKKTRQYISKSERETNISQIEHTDGEMIKQMLQIYRETAKRAGFEIHPDEYYLDLAREMGEQNVIYGSFVQNKPVAFLWNIRSKATEFELYGGVNETGQKLRSNYGLKWQAITRAERLFVRKYDMNGLLNDGISEFKLHFANDEVVERVGTWDYYPSILGRALNFAMILVRKARKKR
jgi:lipid II:glycine glycyltransferase (peptidoglycan interpeptide bridge formation enzyme)